MQGGKRKWPRNYIGTCGNIYERRDLFAAVKGGYCFSILNTIFRTCFSGGFINSFMALKTILN